MTYAEMHNLVNEAVKQIESENHGYCVGIRFEDLERKVGDVCERSKHNPDREDERSFPEWGTEEYDDLPELDGTSAWYIDHQAKDPAMGVYVLRPAFSQKMSSTYQSFCEHAYIVGGNNCCTHSDADHGEVVIVDAVVLAVIY